MRCSGPTHTDHPMTLQEQQTSLPKEPAAPDQQTRPRILIVEDEMDIARLLAFRLKKENYRTSSASDGLEACRLFKQAPPDCILLDVMLPGMNGWEVCHHIRSHRDRWLATTPIIMLTALGDTASRIKGMTTGADAYISKPYSMKELLLHIRRFVEERYFQQSLQQEIQALRRENRNIIDLRSLLCHELRSQLTIIGGYCRRISRTKNLADEFRLRQYVEHIEKSALHLKNISDEMLLISQIESGTLSLAGETCVFAEIINEVRELYEVLAAANRITLDIRTHGDDNTVLLNRSAGRLILSSLLENAIKYSPPDRTVTIETACSSRTGTFTLRVMDEGPGIPADEQEKIFEKYYRGKQARNSTQGTGLGLYAVRMLAHATDGIARVEKAPAGGACFTVSWPLTDRHRKADTPAS